jgi:hypothetical protein
MAVTVLMMFFWVKSPLGLVGRNQHFGKACCLHPQGFRTSALKMETVRFPETLASTNQSIRRLNPKEHHKNFLSSLVI